MAVSWEEVPCLVNMAPLALHKRRVIDSQGQWLELLEDWGSSDMKYEARVSLPLQRGGSQGRSSIWKYLASRAVRVGGQPGDPVTSL